MQVSEDIEDILILLSFCMNSFIKQALNTLWNKEPVSRS